MATSRAFICLFLGELDNESRHRNTTFSLVTKRVARWGAAKTDSRTPFSAAQLRRALAESPAPAATKAAAAFLFDAVARTGEVLSRAQFGAKRAGPSQLSQMTGFADSLEFTAFTKTDSDWRTLRVSAPGKTRPAPGSSRDSAAATTELACRQTHPDGVGAVNVVGRYLASRRGDPPTSPLWLKPNGKEVSVRDVTAMLEPFVGRPIKGHEFRVSGASAALAAGASIDEIMALGRWDSASSARLYCRRIRNPRPDKRPRAASALASPSATHHACSARP
jgi:hypothetical protein